MNESKTRALALGLSLACLPSLAQAQAERQVWVLDPGLPATLDAGITDYMLDNLQESLSLVLGEGDSLRRNTAAGALVLRSDAATRQAAQGLAESLRAKMLANLPNIQASADENPHHQRYGQAVQLRIQIARASRDPIPGAPIPPELAASLGQTLGFRGFQLVGQTAAHAVLGDTTEFETRIPGIRPKSPLSIELKLTPRPERDGGTLMKVAFKVEERNPGWDEPPEGVETPILTSLATTYRIRPGVPMVIGASPLDQDDSLVFLVHHSGEGIEGQP